MQMRALCSQRKIDIFLAKVIWDFEKWTKINVQNPFLQNTFAKNFKTCLFPFLQTLSLELPINNKLFLFIPSTFITSLAIMHVRFFIYPFPY